MTATTSGTAPDEAATRPPRRTRRSGEGRAHAVGGRDRTIDAAFVAVLTVVALLALQPAFGGSGAVLVGAVGAGAGITAALVSEHRRLGPLGTLVVAAGAFVVASGPAVGSEALVGFLPTPGSLQALGRGLVHGWIDSLTTAAPVGVGGGMGVVPYVAGFVAGVGGALLARRSGLVLVPILPVLGVLAGCVLFGTPQPQSVVLQGAGTAVVAMAWGAIRSNRPRRNVAGEVYWPRIISGAAMLAVVGAAGLLVGSSLPGVEADERYTLRSAVEPPFDPRDYPSPLGAIRNYYSDEASDEVFFTMSGLPPDASIRLSTMDTYDGVVWVVGGPASSASGSFVRVGTSVVPAPDGASVTLEGTVEGYAGVWVPTVGATRSVRFEGARAEALGPAFRYNAATGDGANPVGLREGDRFRVEARLDPPDREAIEDAVIDSAALALMPPLPALPQDLVERAGELARGAVTPGAKALQLESFFQQGFHSHGGPEATGPARSAPGHSLFRLRGFLDPARRHPVGNEEQYAAAMALVARSQGLPARVVLGFTVPEEDRDGDVVEVRGTHADAWVEIAFEDHGWVPFHPTPDRDRVPEPQPQEEPEPIELTVQEPPASRYFQPPDIRPNIASDDREQDDDEPEEALAASFAVPGFVLVGLTYGGPPLLLVAGGATAIVAAKSRRRRRRRRRGSPAERAAGAWSDALDAVRDLGVAVPRQGTRREVAAVAPGDSAAPALAAEVDTAMFGPDDPTPDTAAALWAHADRYRAALHEPLTWRQSLRAKVSTRSLRRHR